MKQTNFKTFVRWITHSKRRYLKLWKKSSSKIIFSVLLEKENRKFMLLCIRNEEQESLIITIKGKTSLYRLCRDLVIQRRLQKRKTYFTIKHLVTCLKPKKHTEDTLTKLTLSSAGEESSPAPNARTSPFSWHRPNSTVYK